MGKAGFRPCSSPTPDYPLLEEGRRLFLRRLGGALLLGAAGSALAACTEVDLYRFTGGIYDPPDGMLDAGVDGLDASAPDAAHPADAHPRDAGRETSIPDRGYQRPDGLNRDQ